MVPLRDRMLLFRRLIAYDKAHPSSQTTSGGLGVAAGSGTVTVITIGRERIVEDGFRQLASLSPAALKGTIRVRFINRQGLDEPGIDQDGVFKEFLELTLRSVFDPELNLFKVN